MSCFVKLKLGEPLLVLLGLPAYYGRFGFEAAGPLGIDCPSVGFGNPHFLIRKLATYSRQYWGEFSYCSGWTSQLTIPEGAVSTRLL